MRDQSLRELTTTCVLSRATPVDSVYPGVNRDSRQRLLCSFAVFPCALRALLYTSAPRRDGACYEDYTGRCGGAAPVGGAYSCWWQWYGYVRKGARGAHVLPHVTLDGAGAGDALPALTGCCAPLHMCLLMEAPQPRHRPVGSCVTRWYASLPHAFSTAAQAWPAAACWFLSPRLLCSSHNYPLPTHYSPQIPEPAKFASKVSMS